MSNKKKKNKRPNQSAAYMGSSPLQDKTSEKPEMKDYRSGSSQQPNAKQF